MSIIHQALKKVQITRGADGLPVYTEGQEASLQENGPAHSKKLSPASVMGIFIILFLLLAVVGWWIFNRVAPQASHQAVLEKQPRLQEERDARPLLHEGNIKASQGSKIDSASNASARGIEREAALEEAKRRNLKGMELYRQGKFNLAKDEFLASLGVFPEYAEAYNNIGLTYKQLGDMKAAEESYKKAIHYKPDYPEAMNNYGVLLEAKGNSKAAREYFKKSIVIAPDYSDPYLNMAIAFEKDKKIEEAITYYERFLSSARQRDESLARDIRERILYLNAGRLAVEENRPEAIGNGQ